MIQIMKASAGSGKTFNLARKYIALLFAKKDRYAYRHILAVTFTNKATDEMKSRIMHELSVLADSPELSGYHDFFVPSVFPDDETLRKEADGLLCNILHDYSAFSVSTIDKFFQQTLKSFSREIGQFSSYQVELDKDSLVAESVDRLLDALTEKDADKLQWLTESAVEQIEQGGRYSLESGLMEIASRLKSDEHRTMVEAFGVDEKEAYSRENLLKVRKGCRQIIRDFGISVQDAAGRVLEIVHAAGMKPEDFNRRFLAAIYNYRDIGGGTVVARPSDSFLSKASDPELWFAKSKPKSMKASVYPVLEGPLNDFCALFDRPYTLYRTAVAIRDQLYGLGIAGDLYREFNALLKEKNVLSIDDSNTILKDIIAGSDAPFIYEKTGVRYDNFLLDEFQDTSRIQWENFLPLLKESQGKGYDCLVVGDVKQSIYRWRGSDWNLLATELQRQLHDTEVDTLDTNYRSSASIVSFNNGFFSAVSEQLDRMYGAAVSRDGVPGVISSVYADVVQKCHSDEQGSVDLTFCPKDMELSKVLESVTELQSHGASLKDIAVLVRNNSAGASVAGYLIANGVRVVTDDSLKVRSSLTVRRLVSLLSFIDNPSDSISGYVASDMEVSVPQEYHSLVDLCEALLRELRTKDEDIFDAETLYIQSFVDCVSDYARVNGNGLRGFLKQWEDMDPAISSPDAGDSVRVMTIHKAKGLDFPYVIVPFTESVTLFRSGRHWCSPDLSGTPLGDACRSVYDVILSAESEYTVFASDYHEELLRQYIDNVNVLYVALTRARKGMHIIGRLPSAKFLDSVSPGEWLSFTDFSQALYNYAACFAGMKHIAGEDEVRFSMGDIPMGWNDGKEADHVAGVGASYPSWPLNPADGMPRLLLGRKPSDFFSGDGEAGVATSGRLKGIVLHDILAEVKIPGDLDGAVDRAVTDGALDMSCAEEARTLLSERIASARGRGWFSERVSVRNETDVIDTDGAVHRPDRVELSPDGNVRIIDYKFGRRRDEYAVQVAAYADLYRRMGYRNVEAAVWYVVQDEVQEIS